MFATAVDIGGGGVPLGLRYVTDAEPGIRRRRAGRGFSFVGPDGKRVTAPSTLARIRSLVIPPAWTDVWISIDPHGHIQATGRDARGRKQYRYHPQWREARDQTKFERMVEFGAALPAIRGRVAEDLRGAELSRDKVLAVVVSLLDRTLVRVGNPEYAKDNHSFGLTTMRDRHVVVEGSAIRFRFSGKSGKEHEVDLADRRLARLVQRTQDLPGHRLFQYVDEHGQPRPVESGDVNDYLRSIAGDGFSAKDFRTWGGTVLVARALLDTEVCDAESEAKSNVVAAIKAAALELGNTPAVTRSAYVHPGVIRAYLDNELTSLWLDAEQRIDEWPQELRREEVVLLAVLRGGLPGGEDLRRRTRGTASGGESGEGLA
jgi:DNA topoisomerase-1